jgi:hypothetical protein
MYKKWTLINNWTHSMHHFTSEKKLKDYAKEHYLKIKIGGVGRIDRCFYTIGSLYVPGNQ